MRRKPYRNREAFVHVLYGEEMTLHLQLPDKADAEMVSLAGRLVDRPIDDVRKLVEFVGQMERLGRNVTVYPDAEELIQRRLFQQRMAQADGRDPRQPRAAPLADQAAQDPAAALSA